MVAVAEHFGHHEALEINGTRILGIFQQSRRETVFFGAGQLPQDPGHKAGHGIHDEKGRQFPARQHIVADAHLGVHIVVDAFVEAFVMAAHENEAPLTAGPLLRQRLAECHSAGAHGQDRRAGQFLPGQADGFGFRLEDHADAAAKRRVVHGTMLVPGKIPGIDAFQLQEARVQATFNHAVAPCRFNLFGEQGDEDEFHRISSPSHSGRRTTMRRAATPMSRILSGTLATRMS